MNAHLTLKEHLNRCMKKARAAEACLLSLKKPYAVVPAGVRAVQVARFIAWLADSCEGSKLKKLHDYPNLWRTIMQSSQERAQTQLDSRDNMLAGPW